MVQNADFFLKMDKAQGVKDQKSWLFTCFLAYNFARTEWKLEYFCKIKNNNLGFELMS